MLILQGRILKLSVNKLFPQNPFYDKRIEDLKASAFTYYGIIHPYIYYFIFLDLLPFFSLLGLNIWFRVIFKKFELELIKNFIEYYCCYC